MPAKKTPRVQKKMKMDMGLMGANAPKPLDVDLLGTKKLVKKQSSKKSVRGENLPSPYDVKFADINKEKLFQSYKIGLKRVNQRMRELEKQGLSQFSYVYTQLLTRGIRTKRGNVGFPQTITDKNIDSTSKSDLLKEYKRVYSSYTAGSSSVEKTREIQEEQLSHLGFDIDEMMKDPSAYKDELNAYWHIYNELENRGILEDFGLSSTEGQEAVKKFLLTNPPPKTKSSIKGMVTNIQNLWNNINAKGGNVDLNRYNELIGRYDENHERLQSAYRRMAYQLAIKAYATKPAEAAFIEENQDEDDRGYLS